MDTVDVLSHELAGESQKDDNKASIEKKAKKLVHNCFCCPEHSHSDESD